MRPPNPRRLLTVLSLLLALLTGSAPATADSTSPDWPLFAGLSGKVVLVDFWASWCGPCLRSFPWMNELQQRHAGEGLVIVAVNLDQDRALADAFLKKLPARFRVEYDPAGQVATRFGVQAMPTSFLIDRRGQVRARHAGFRDALRTEREHQIQQLLKETPP